ncbi:MAG: hypothetical protein RLZZ440_304 [Planctomycetota bacterium]
MNGLDRGAAAAGLRLAAIHAREPAAWIAAATAALPGLWLWGGVDPERGWLLVPVAIASGGLATTAALGDPPTGLPDGRRGPWLPLWLARVAWPLVACLAAGGLAALGDPLPALLQAVGGLVGGAAALAGGFAAHKAGCRGALAASSGLLAAAAGAGIAFGAGLLRVGPVGQLAAAAGSLAALSVVWRLARPEAAAASAGMVDGAASAVRSLAMLAALAAMVVCFFLAPQLAAGYAVVVVAWFVCLAVPAATGGLACRPAARLAASAVGRPALPGSVPLALTTAVFHAALLGWPAVVALVLPPVAGLRAVSPGVAIGWLVAAGALVVGVVAVCRARHGEVARATLLAATAAAAVMAATRG